MEGSGNLKGRVFRLEQRIGWDDSLPCAGCGQPHVRQVVGIDWLQECYAGRGTSLGDLCACECCIEETAELLARFRRSREVDRTACRAE